MRFVLICLLLFFTLGAGKRQPVSLTAAIDHVLDSHPEFASAFLGIDVVRLPDGKTLYERNQDHLFVPASNTKLFTSALALMRLGPDYRFKTSVVENNGDLVLIGRGDPSMSARQYPYTPDPSEGNPFQAIEDLADRLVSGGLKEVPGDIVGDDTRYAWLPYAPAWSMDDRIWEYGAPVSALVLNDNRLDVTILPGPGEGEPALISIQPGFEFFTIDNRVVTQSAGARQIVVDERFGSPEISFRGAIPLSDRGDINQLAVPDPALFAASVLRAALIHRGVVVHGHAVARHRYPGEEAAPVSGRELASRQSPPLPQLLQIVNKVSQNLHAEIMLREVGAVRRGDGTVKAGLAEMHDFLSEVGIAEDQYSFVDGSGLSRTTLVTPQAVTKLLLFMYNSPLREQWIAMLPVGAEDGSLKKRFKGHPEAKAIHAKTGTLSHVRALSGYAETAQDGQLAFSLIVNNYLAKDAEVNQFLDNIGLKLIPRGH